MEERKEKIKMQLQQRYELQKRAEGAKIMGNKTKRKNE